MEFSEVSYILTILGPHFQRQQASLTRRGGPDSRRLHGLQARTSVSKQEPYKTPNEVRPRLQSRQASVRGYWLLYNVARIAALHSRIPIPTIIPLPLLEHSSRFT